MAAAEHSLPLLVQLQPDAEKGILTIPHGKCPQGEAQLGLIHFRVFIRPYWLCLFHTYTCTIFTVPTRSHMP